MGRAILFRIGTPADDKRGGSDNFGRRVTALRFQRQRLCVVIDELGEVATAARIPSTALRASPQLQLRLPAQFSHGLSVPVQFPHDLIVRHFDLLPRGRLNPGGDRTLLAVYEMVYGSISSGLPIGIIAEPLD
jgi:hypothetical protein